MSQSLIHQVLDSYDGYIGLKDFRGKMSQSLIHQVLDSYAARAAMAAARAASLNPLFIRS